jgi:O-antigen ligase
MGFVLTLIYIALALLSPVDLLPSLAEYRVELLLVLVTLLFSLPGLLDSRFFRIPQVYLLAGLFVAVFLSEALASQWIGGGWIALQHFLPAAVVFYLVVLNCQNVRRLRMLVFLLAVIAVFYVIQGARAYLAGDLTSSFLQVIRVSDGTVALRMEGLGFLHDPNELAQFLVMILPFVWIRWRQGSALQNALFVIAPTAFFIWGIYLTHSRGAIIALVVILMLALKDRMSLLPTIVGGVLAFSLFMAINFSGGREISLQGGSDRLALWGDGLRLFRQSPLFGVGFESFPAEDFGHTAHNSFVVCLAELGIVGYSLWVGLLVFTFAGLNSLIASLSLGPAEADSATSNHDEISEMSDSEIADVDKWARAIRISLAGFLAAAWFLSRAYVLPLYLILGMAVALLCLASEEEEPIARKPMWRLFSLTARLGFAAIALVYVSLRVRSVFS